MPEANDGEQQGLPDLEHYGPHMRRRGVPPEGVEPVWYPEKEERVHIGVGVRKSRYRLLVLPPSFQRDKTVNKRTLRRWNKGVPHQKRPRWHVSRSVH